MGHSAIWGYDRPRLTDGRPRRSSQAGGKVIMPRLRRPALAAVALALVLSLLLSAQGVEAARGWCYADPVVVVDGQLADVYLASDLAMLTSASGAIQLVVTVPVNSTAKVLL